MEEVQPAVAESESKSNERLGDRLAYALLSAIAWGAGKLSPWMAQVLARILAMIVFDIFRIRRRLVLKNLRHAAPTLFAEQKSEAELTKLARRSYEQFALTVIEMFASRYVDPVRGVKLRGRANVDGAIAEGKGICIVCAHLGNWETMGVACSRLVVPAHVVVKRVGRGGVARFVEDLRRDAGFLAIERKKRGDGYRAIATALQRGEAVGFVLDQARDDLRLPFLGRDAKTNSSLAKLWLRYRMPIVPAYCVRISPFQHELRFLEPLVLEEIQGEAEEATLARLTLHFNGVLEGMIKQQPDQYFWLHNRWK